MTNKLVRDVWLAKLHKDRKEGWLLVIRRQNVLFFENLSKKNHYILFLLLLNGQAYFSSSFIHQPFCTILFIVSFHGIQFQVAAVSG